MPAPRNDPPTTRRDRFTLAWGVTLAGLLLTTWPLWTPGRATPPRLPPLWPIAPPLEAAAAALLGGALLAVLVQGKRWAVGATTLALAVLMAGDQLRWQPWAYHAVLAGALLWSADRSDSRPALRWIGVAVYAWSALAKLDAEFAATLGSQLVGVVAPFAGPEARFALAFTIPMAELAVALLLAASHWKASLAAWACGAAVAMHAATILLLSPAGLGHSLGVLLWNAGFAWQTVVLFRRPREQPAVANRWSFAAVAVALLGVVAPALAPFGLWDAWPGWALYAPRLERATLFVREGSVDRLPEPLRPHVGPVVESGGWRPIDLAAWTLEATHAPLYPDNRVVAKTALELIERRPLVGRLAVAAESAAAPVTRERQQRWIVTEEALREAADWRTGWPWQTP